MNQSQCETKAVALVAQPRGWHRPIRPTALVFTGLSLLMVWVVLMASAVVWFYGHYESVLRIKEQALNLRLPGGLPAMAEVSHPLRITLPPSMQVSVPVRQTIPVQIKDQFQARVHFEASVPINTKVHVRQEVLVSTVVQLHAPVFKWLPSFDVSVPMVLRLPVDMVVPVVASVPVDLDMLVSGEIEKELKLPIDTIFTLHAEVTAPVEARMQTLTAFALKEPQAAVPVMMVDSALRLPFDLMAVTHTPPR